MLCPSCGKGVHKNQWVRANVRGLDDVDVVYDVVCPFCRITVGSMFWGELIMKGSPSVPIWLNSKEGTEKQEEAGPKVYVCPHCGGELPRDIESLPLKRQEGDRRKGSDRRRNGDRRVSQEFFLGPDRRKGDRRKGDRRINSDRRAKKPTGSLTEDRRKAQRPVLYDRRNPAQEQKKPKDRDSINAKI